MDLFRVCGVASVSELWSSFGLRLYDGLEVIKK